MLTINKDGSFDNIKSIIAFVRKYENTKWYSLVDNDRKKISLATDRTEDIIKLYKFYYNFYDIIGNDLNDFIHNKIKSNSICWHGTVENGCSELKKIDSKIKIINNIKDLHEWIGLC